MNNMLSFVAVILTLLLVGCTNENDTNSEEQKRDSHQEQTTTAMNTFVSLFEIPATDLSRAITFYETILDIQIEKMEIPEMEMGVFPYEDQVVTGVIMKGEGYTPTADGVTIYLNGGNDLQTILDKVEPNGGKILVSKTAHADESGFFALFLDSEGNKLGLNSPN